MSNTQISNENKIVIHSKRQRRSRRNSACVLCVWIAFVLCCCHRRCWRIKFGASIQFIIIILKGVRSWTAHDSNNQHSIYFQLLFFFSSSTLTQSKFFSCVVKIRINQNKNEKSLPIKRWGNVSNNKSNNIHIVSHT